jgi:hypothetical protein
MTWLYPEKASIKVSNLCPAVESTNWSIRGRGKLSFGQALLRSVKSTHIPHLPLAFFTMTTLASQSG